MAVEMLGPYPFSFPDLFTDISVNHRGPLHHANAVAGRGVSYGFTIVVGLGTEGERKRFVAQMIEALQPTRHDVEPVSHAGNSFVGHEIDHDVAGVTVTTHHFVGFAFGDLVACSVTYPAGDDRAESLCRLALSTMSGAIVRHGPGDSSPPRPWWKFWGRA
jgi:hypothetical protein